MFFKKSFEIVTIFRKILILLFLVFFGQLLLVNMERQNPQNEYLLQFVSDSEFSVSYRTSDPIKLLSMYLKSKKKCSELKFKPVH